MCVFVITFTSVSYLFLERNKTLNKQIGINNSHIEVPFVYPTEALQSTGNIPVFSVGSRS